MNNKDGMELENNIITKTTISGVEDLNSSMNGNDIPKQPMYYQIRKSKNDKNEYVYKKLKNNLKCILIYDKDADKSAAALTVNVGSLCDPDEFEGLAHFLEHMLFMGTEKYPNENDFSEFLSKNSGDSNAYTGLECTQYYFDVKNESFLEALDRFAQFFIKPMFNKSAVEREMKAVESEHKKNMRSDSNRFLEIFRYDSNPSTPFSKFQTGSLETLKKPNVRKELKNFHNEFYSSNIMNLCILSNIPLEKLELLIDELFSNIKELDIDVNEIRSNYTPDGVYPYTSGYNLEYFYEIQNIKEKNILAFYWVINENVKTNMRYKYDPLEYIVSLLHHEGKNSLTSSLLKDELITDLESSYEVIAHTFTQVYVVVHLTDKGYSEYKEIIKRVLSFIQRLKTLPVNKDYFDEIQKMTHVDFDYFEKDDPVSFCSDLCDNMTIYEPEDVLAGAYLIENYDEDMIKKYLNMLTCENMNIYFCSNKFDGQGEVLTEKWYGTKYKKQKINFNEYLTGDSDNYFNNYTSPIKNYFIPKNFDLREFDNIDYEFPKVISSVENYYSVWYKPDVKFKVPKAFLMAQIYLPFSHYGTFCNNEFTLNSDKFSNNLDYAHYETYLTLWQDLFYEELKETIYLGSLARIDFGFYNNKMGLAIELSGFNDAIKLFAQEIFTLFVKISDHKNIENFKNKLLLKIESRLRIERNSFKSSANAQVSNKLSSFLSSPHVCLDKSIEILEELKEEITKYDKFSKFEYFLKNYLSRAYFEWLVQGNILPSEGIEIVSYVHNLIQKSGMKSIEINAVRTVKLPADYNFYHIFQSQDEGNENSAVMSYFQVGYLTEKESCLLELIEQILYDKFFDELRTKQALGYVVQLIHRFNRKIQGLTCLVQSNVQCPEFIINKINKFFEDFNLTDENNLTDQDFKSHVDALINNLKQKDLTMADEVDRNFGEIKIREYVFNRDAEKIKIYEKEITKKEVMDFYEEHFIINVRRLDVELVSNNHKKENENFLTKNLKGEVMTKDEEFESAYPVRVGVRHEEVLKRMCDLYPDYYYYIKK